MRKGQIIWVEPLWEVTLSLSARWPYFFLVKESL